MDYKLVKYCRLCNKRFLVERSEKRTSYCDSCLKKMAKEKKE